MYNDAGIVSGLCACRWRRRAYLNADLRLINSGRACIMMPRWRLGIVCV